MMKWKRNSLGSVTRIALVVLCCGLASRAHAQDLPDVRAVCAPEASPRRVRMEHEGITGWWFHGDLVRCMLGRLDALPLYADRVSLLERRAELSDERYEILSEALRIDDAIQERYETALTAATRREAELGAWYRSPVLWAVVGAVVAGALVALSAYALDAAGGP